MTAVQRDAEEKSYYESRSTVTPIKDMHRSGKDDAGRYTDTGTGGYEAVSDYAKDIAWQERQDEQLYENGLTFSNDKRSILNKVDETIENTLALSGKNELLNKWETFKGNATAAWDVAKDFFEDGKAAVNKFISENKDQLDYKTDTLKVVKDVCKDYRKQGIDINQFDVENYVNKYGTAEFVDKINNSTMIDANRYPNNVFWTEKEANISYADEANPIKTDDNRETGNILIKVPVTFQDENGEEYVVNMYTKDDTFEEMQDNIVTGTVARIAAYSMDPFNPIPISITHTHPEDGMTNKFSRGFGDEFAARMPGVKNMYMNDVETGAAFLFDESMPNTVFKRQGNIDYGEDYEIEIIPENENSLPYIKP